MQGVRLERLAGVLFGHFVECPGACQVDAQSHEKDKDGRQAGLDMNGMKEQAGKGLVNNVQRGEEQEAGFNESGKILKFSVAVWMARISGLIGNSSYPVSGMTIATLMATCAMFLVTGWTANA